MVRNGSALAFQNMILQGIPEGANSSKAGDNVIPDLSIWPSVSAEPGAMVRSWPCPGAAECLHVSVTP